MRRQRTRLDHWIADIVKPVTQVSALYIQLLKTDVDQPSSFLHLQQKSGTLYVNGQRHALVNATGRHWYRRSTVVFCSAPSDNPLHTKSYLGRTKRQAFGFRFEFEAGWTVQQH